MNEKKSIELRETAGVLKPTGKKSWAESVMACLIAALMALQSAGGLFIRGLYREPALTAAAWIGNDLVTLAVAVPLLVVSLIFTLRGSFRARLVYLGMVYYELYNNMYYLFGTPFNRFFLVYEALFVLSAAALILGLSKIEIGRAGDAFKPRTPRRLASGFMLIPVIILSVLWIAETAASMASGNLPKMAIDNGWQTHLPAIFDLSLIVIPYLAAAVWLWRSRPWGYVAAPIVLVQGGLYTIVLIAVAPFWAAAGAAGAWDQVPIWAALGVGCILFAFLLLGNMKKNPPSTDAEPAPGFSKAHVR